MKYTINNHKHIYTKENPDLCDLCGLLKSTLNCDVCCPTPKPQSMSWIKEFDDFFREDGFSTDANDVKSFIQSLLQHQREEAFKDGRQSVLDEWKEQKDKLLKGFSYKKNL